MRKKIYFFALCLSCAICTALASDVSSNSRSLQKHLTDTSNTINNGRNNTKKSVRTTTQRAANTQANNNRVINTRTPAVKTRSLINKPNITSSTKITETKSNKRLKTRTAVTNTISSNNNKKNIITKRTNASRAATINEDALKNIKSKNLSVCKTTYYNCMDEFCANKDTSLRRCSCSKRIHEFDSIKQQLANFEDKMLDFNQRLLTVSMSKEDAAAINVATEGEQAYQQKDSSESQKILDKITKALNSDSDSKLNTNLSAISLSLNESAAWDNIDSTSGISTASKEGVDLYNAALPVCQEMAKEVCTDDDLNIVQDNYLLSIEQDCNTVSKSYNSQYNAAKDKIYESSALLDMSRLNAYQQKNSDDILTCKSKMLEELSSTSVCGSNLSKCLDTTGRYIDPSTGEAFLSKNLYQLANILQEPKANQTWISVPTNTNFVTFLNSKKTYLTTVLSSCQESADIIWNDFLNDALAQIKIAQNAKLEEVKQSCTTLLTECTTSALKTLEDFDARALSVFNLQANITANNMCSNIKSSCMALMQNTQNNNDSSDYDWSTGIEGITTDILFSKIIENCTLVGQNCIIEQCNGIAGNFSLCTNINSQKYKDIITQKSCWNDIIQCIDQTSGYLQSISDKTETDGSYYYNNIDNIGLGSTFFSNVYDPESQIHKRCSCSGETGEKSIECLKCLIAERIFGNCSNASIGELDEGQESVVLKPKSDKTTLLYWFVSNTNNTNTQNNCSTQSPKYYLNYNINKTVTSVTFTSERWPIICENNICTNLAESGYNLYFVKEDEDCGSSSNRYYTGQSYNNPETISLKPCTHNEPTEYKITYNLDGGKFTSTQNHPTTYNIKTPSTIIAAPEKSGYTFAGWCTDADRTQNCSTTARIGGNGNTGDITLYAKWEAKGFPITYNLCPVNDTNCEEKDIQNNNPPTYTVETETIILQAPTRTGYTFLGWYSNSNYSNKATQISRGSNGPIVLYAKWTPIKYNITYDLDGGQFTSDEDHPTTYDITTPSTIIASPEKSGYIFAGWCTDTARTQNCSTTVRIGDGNTGDITLYAKWVAEGFPITYYLCPVTDTNCEEKDIQNNNPSTYTVETNTITLQVPTRTGYTFLGWTDCINNNNAMKKIPDWMMQQNTSIKLCAYWSPETYNITYYLDNNGEYWLTGTYTIEDTPKNLITPTNEQKPTGYDFDGWYTTQNLSGEAVTTIPNGSTEDKTFWAKWTPITYNITYNLDGGTNYDNAPTSYTIESPTITLGKPTKEGYTFNGWFTNDTKKITTISKGSTGAITLYAKWEKIESSDTPTE